MRIVLDMQGAQSASRARGIGRYTLSFAKAVVRHRGKHDVVLALNGLFPETVEPIRAAFEGLLPQTQIRVWQAPGPVTEGIEGNDSRREVAELLREAFFASFEADVVHISSLFEGYVDDAVTSIGRLDLVTPVSVAFYDLIPLLNPEQYLAPQPRYSRYYLKKIEHLQRASVCLAISEFSRLEGVTHLTAPAPNFVNVSTAIEPCFQPVLIDDKTANRLFLKYGISSPFILYTGGADERKNLPRLIQAFAALPEADRARHQLVFAGRIVPEEMHGLLHQVKQSRLKPRKVCFTGYVPEEDLVQLYNLCALFVFPSWHEGFGLPALEAMACGAPVIGANTSSLPEVIGLDEALFDPLDVAAIAAKMHDALTDDAFRSRLREHGPRQARFFSWDETAKRAIAAWEALPAQAALDAYLGRSTLDSRLEDRLADSLRDANDDTLRAVSSCLAMNRQSGMTRQLLVDVSAWAGQKGELMATNPQIDLLKTLMGSSPSGFRIEPVYASHEDGYRYARAFTQRLLGHGKADVQDAPLNWQRGDMFFVLAAQHPLQWAFAHFYQQLREDGVNVKFFVQDLLPIELTALMQDPVATELHGEWLSMIASSDGAVFASKTAADAFEQWLSNNAPTLSPSFQRAWAPIHFPPDDTASTSDLEQEVASVLDAMRHRTSFVCMDPLEPWCGQDQMLDAFQLIWENEDINLVLTGQPSWRAPDLIKRICLHPEFGQRLFWLHGANKEDMQRIHAASTCLIAGAHGDADGHVLFEAARHRLPILARDIPLYRELAGGHVFHFQGTGRDALASALTDWLDLYRQGRQPLSEPIALPSIEETCARLKQALIPDSLPRRQLLVDISELVQHDAKSGIQRVVRNILIEWLKSPPRGYRVEPVCATLERGYRYARRFTSRFMGLPDPILPDSPIDFAPGDIFLGLDLQPTVVPRHREFFQFLRRQGVRVEFVVYDLLSVLMPTYFPPGAEQVFTQWLDVVTECDGVVCISQSVAQELTEWTRSRSAKRLRPFRIRSFHLGVEASTPTVLPTMTVEDTHVMDSVAKRPSFLMVGTLEPRKGHAQALDGLEQLWRAGHDLNLIIIGKKGWMTDALVERLDRHPERNARLFWLDGISDDTLERLYAKSTCLIAASFGEGFGLPLIEAALHNLPILARDIPVFREVAGEHADYFRNDKAPSVLSDAVLRWLRLYENGQHIRSSSMRTLSWPESAAQLMSALDAPQQHALATHASCIDSEDVHVQNSRQSA
jgi:glycosyltransferase involved in cell wall biosynthesis